MAAFSVGQHQIARIGRIELVDLVCIIQNGNIPFEKIDEYPLARLEHYAKCWIRRASLERNWGVLHGGYLAI